jgi:trimeric autotransporter adhesin
MRSQTSKLALTLMSVFFFSVTAIAQVNNSCTNAALIVPDSVCIAGASQLTGQTLTGGTYVAGELGTTTSACTFVAAPDVWYKFVARTKYPTVTVSSLGGGWGTSLKLQLLQGTCNSFTEVACANNAPMTPSLTSPLVPGTTYYIRVHRNNTTSPAPANLTFNICITDPLEKGNRMNEVFVQTVLSGSGALQYPWEVTYGPDDSLWVTESKGYKVYKMSAATGVKRMVLDISQGSTFLPSAERPLYNCQFSNGAGAQGGLAGLALHPDFLSGNNSVYVSYIYSGSGNFFTNKLVMFNYNTTTGLLETPVSLCDSLPGSNDHNSQRMIVAPVTPGGTKYLFYASGDMGAGQGSNVTRPIKSQLINSYEGKILRFNLVPDLAEGTYDKWIPNANPYNGLPGVGAQSAVWNIGIRNNQGFAYDSELNILYGSSHGAYSDDELNIIDSFTNYGHPLIIGYAADGNYDGDTSVASTRYSGGAPYTTVGSGYSTCPPISSENNRKNTINLGTTGQYKDPIFSAYPGPTGTGSGTVKNIWSTTNGANAGWPSEGWSGIDLYTANIIPGWRKSIIAGGLKWGRLIKLKLGAAGNTTMPSNLGGVGNSTDTVTYFQSVNRYRDLAIGPNGKDFYLVMDNNAATSGPGTNNPIVAACPGCVIKYSFIGYQAATAAPGVSMIPKNIDVTDGIADACNNGTTVTIDGTNNFLWVPITGPDGNIMAEINAMGQNLGAVNSSFFRKSPGGIRSLDGVPYLDRNITITPTVNGPYATNVKVRLYISKTEFDDFVNNPVTTLTNINQLRVFKKNDPFCYGAMSTDPAVTLTPTNTIAADLQHGANGYVLQVDVPSFSSFYFAENTLLLPVETLTFAGTLQNNLSTLLNWKTEHESNTGNFIVERSTDGVNFSSIGTVKAAGSSSIALNYSFTDIDVANQASLIVYYRLKVTDLNGTFKYSNIINVALPVTKGSITVSPNPAVTDIKIAVSSPVTVNSAWQIIDISGRTVLYGDVLLKKGNNNLPVNIKRLAAGTYYVQVKGDGIDVKTKFSKQ